jgi:hypothetical protein
MLIAHLDESGHSGSTDFFAMAAFVGEDAQWGAFDKAWQAALAAHEAPYLHMREFAHRTGAFKGWTEERRRGLLSAAVGAINDARLEAIAVAMSVSDFRALNAEEQVMFQDPFFSCFQEVSYGVQIMSDRTPAPEKIRVVFSLQDDFGPKLRKLWTALQQRSKVLSTKAELQFDDMRQTPGLQAADLLAYELRHFYDMRQKRPADISRWPFRALVWHQYRVLGTRMLKYLPLWYLKLQASAVFDEAMRELFSDPARFFPLIAELTPTPRGPAP